MARYIDADKMTDGYCTTFPYNLDYCDDGDLMEWLNAQPSADVVEVVRCKDCRSWEECGIDPITNYYFGYCRHFYWQDEDNSRETNGQDFCSYGERKE